ncbi:tail fiber domain-containing protein [Polaribacter sp. HL-MS24]|uniref:tail fiber domain-containing protein n=1 Tax=Polaribacter sp. HL-MS24 TaxID=3077735 RepID=UPI0029344A16|nr:tail fiber domain-containing protein [Polaribacter sp. HL-MS24]WOC39347.1 tail fiber domain-containing protein [Polaribacter sp. HL-MS24]
MKAQIIGFVLFGFLCVQTQAQQVRVIDNKGTISNINNSQVTTAALAPTSPLEGDVWFDTTDPNNRIAKVYDGTTWQLIKNSWLGNSTIYHNTISTLALTEALHNNADIHLENTGNVSITNTDVTDATNFYITNTTAANRTLTFSGFTGAHLRNGGTIADVATGGLTLKANTRYLVHITNNGGNFYFNATEAVSGGETSFTDADTDTRIQVEETADDDSIRFDTAGIERMVINELGHVGINTPAPLDSFHVTDGFNLTHTATQDNDHAQEIDYNAAGFGDSKALDIVYTSGAITQGDDESVILINVDESASLGGNIIGLEILGTEGNANLYGVDAGVGINPLIQLAGAFANPSIGLVNGADQLAAFISSASDVGIFSNDNETLTVGLTSKFEEIEFLFDTPASGGGIAPTFEYSTGVGTWLPFTPTDGTNGMQNSGVLAWLSDDTPSWVASGGNYLVRITRTKNNLTTTPIEEIIKVAEVIEYLWDKNGKIRIGSIHNTGVYEDANIETGTAGQVLSSTGTGTDWVDPFSEVVLDLTPELGGDLDVNGKKIISVSNGNIEIAPNGTGDFTINTDDLVVDTSAGFLGIGTAAPDQKLSVNGNASKTGGGSWATFSDRRVKDNVRNYTEGLNKLKLVRPVRFNYTEKSGYRELTKDYVGVIAQEIEQVLPGTVTKYDDRQGPSGLSDKRQFDASELVWTSINAIKELAVEIENLETNNKALLKRIQILERLLERIELLEKAVPND